MALCRRIAMRKPGEAAAELGVERAEQEARALAQVALGQALARLARALEARDRGSAVLLRG